MWSAMGAMDHAMTLPRSGLIDSLAKSTPEIGFDTETERRLEDWIVGTLDDRAASPFDADWEGRLGRSSPLANIGPNRGTRGLTQGVVEAGGWPRFRVASGRGITVVSLTDDALVRENDLEELVGDLLALIDAGHHRLVLDFGRVDRLSIHAAGARRARPPVRRGGSWGHEGLRASRRRGGRLRDGRPDRSTSGLPRRQVGHQRPWPERRR